MNPPVTAGPPGGPSPAGRRRIPELDGLRGLAILLVLTWHYVVSLLVPAPGTLLFALKKSLWITSTGVDLFFVLSGFLLGGILLENARSPGYYTTFYGRRAARILPIYYVVLLLFGLGLLLKPAGGHPAADFLLTGPLPLWSYATFTQNFVMADVGHFGASGLSVTWSLAIEEQFYLVLPFLLRAVPRPQLPVALTLFIAAAPLCRIFLVFFQNPSGFSGYVLMPGRADALLFGVLAAWALRDKGLAEKLARNRAKTRWALALGVVVTLGMGALGMVLPHALILQPGHTWLAFFYAFVIVLAVTEGRGPVSWVGRNRLLGRLGLVSYGVYLFHQPVLGLVHGFARHQRPALRGGADAVATLGALGATLLLAAISWRLLEKPIVKLGHRLKY